MAEKLGLTLREPLIFPLVPPSVRPAIVAYWGLIDQLVAMASATGEPALRQIRLAWWRDQLECLASSGGQVDPVLVAVQAHALSAIEGSELAAMADQLIAAIGAEDPTLALCQFGEMVFHQSARVMASTANGGAAWGCAIFAEGRDDDTSGSLWRVTASSRVESGSSRALRALDVLCRRIGRRGGRRSFAAEQALVLRVGLFGR
jgi:hypothetical protein